MPLEVHFNQRFAVPPRSDGGVSFIVDPIDGITIIYQYKDGDVAGKVMTTLKELEEVVEKGRKAYHDYREMERKWLEERDKKDAEESNKDGEDLKDD